MLKTRVITALLLAAGFFLGLFFLPEPAWAVLVAAVVWLAAWEWCALVKAVPWGRYVFASAVAVPVALAGFMPRDVVLMAFAFVSAMALWIFTAPTLLRFQPRLDGFYPRFVLGAFAIMPAGLAMIELRSGSPLLLLMALLPVSIADIAAYFVGRKWGRNKLAPTISPGKSREGAAGGIAAVVVYAIALGLLFPAVSAKIPLGWLVPLAVLYALLSIEGDLFESMLKRQAQVKDSGTLLPGHGGVLDRIDSLLSTLPLAALLWMIFR